MSANNKNIFRVAVIHLVVLLTVLTLNAQSVTDSLTTVLKDAPADTSKIKIYYALSYRYIYVHHQDSVARKYADSVRLLSEKLNYQAGGMLSVYLHALLNMNAGKYDDAKDQLQDYIRFFSARGDSLRVAAALYSVGLIHARRGEYEKNLTIQFQLASIYEKKNDKLRLANTLSSIGNAYLHLNKFNEAGTMHKRANAFFKELGLEERYAMGLQNLANACVSAQRYDTAQLLYEQALLGVRKLGLQAEEGYILGNLGYLFEKLHEDEKALDHQQRALEIWTTLPHKRNVADALDNIGYLHFKHGNYAGALKYFEQALAIAKEFSARPLLSELYRELAETYAGQQDFKMAYHYNQLWTQVKDSIFNEENVCQINELKTKYETERKDKQIALLAKEKEIQTKDAQRQLTFKKALVAVLALVLLLAALSSYVFMQKMRNQKLIAVKDNEIKEATFRSQVTELKMKALRAQINPHFLFNCMNSINRMILDGENENASLYLAKFSKLVRLILENAENSQVSLQHELTLLESYIQLEGLRFKGKIHYKILVNKNIDPFTLYLPAMILQPFVENAIWHGLMHKADEEQGMVKIAVNQKDGRIFCVIEDNGIGRKRAGELAERSILKSKSLGVKITEERLQLLSRTDWRKAVHIIDVKDSLNRALGTRVEITIPVS